MRHNSGGQYCVVGTVNNTSILSTSTTIRPRTTKMASSQLSPSWINIPPPIPSEYSAKGSWRQVGELYSYVTGPPTATKAVVFIYDVFGPSPQCLQGADRLAEHLNAIVLMPDYFKGCALDHDDFVGETARDGTTALEEHMRSHGDYQKNVLTTLQYVTDAQLKFPSVQKWGCFGLCWGGKVATMATFGNNNPFVVTGQAHPPSLDMNDAHSVRTPHICLVGKSQPAEITEQFDQTLRQRRVGEVVVFDTLAYGWMGAHANLRDHETRSQYERGYAQAAQFFSQHW